LESGLAMPSFLCEAADLGRPQPEGAAVRISRTHVIALSASLALVLAGCSSDGGSGGAYGGGGTTATTAAPTATTATTTAPAASGGASSTTLTASGTRWLSSELTFKAGEKVSLQVKNDDDIEHNFTFAKAKADTDIEGGETATVAFTAPAAGTYTFVCEYHPAAMKGTVTVS
jgi:plastocyanin